MQLSHLKALALQAQVSNRPSNPSLTEPKKRSNFPSNFQANIGQKLDKKLEKQIEKALKIGYKLYQKRGWI